MCIELSCTWNENDSMRMRAHILACRSRSNGDSTTGSSKSSDRVNSVSVNVGRTSESFCNTTSYAVSEESLASEQPLAMTELKRQPVWPAALGPEDIEALCDNFIINEWLKANWHQTTSTSGTGEYSYCRLLTELTDGQLAASAHR